jgi:hypothetical protein
MSRIKLKKSSVAGRIPSASDLEYGEVAINIADGKLYFKNSSNVIQSFEAGSFVDSASVIGLIDSAYIQARQTSGAGGDGLDSAEVNTLIADGLEHAFSRILVDGQFDVVADSTADGLTFVAGNNVTITTTPLDDTITFETSAIGADSVQSIIDSNYVQARTTAVDLSSAETGLVWNRTGTTAQAANYRDSDSETFTIRTTAITNDLLTLTLASFTPTLTVTGQSLNFDQAATGFTVSVDNPTDFTTRYINSVSTITETAGDVHETLTDYTAGAKSATPAGGVDWTQTFSTNATASIKSTSTTIVGGTAQATIEFLDNDGVTFDTTATLTTNWQTPNLSINMSDLSGNVFLNPYENTSYSVNLTGMQSPSNYSITVTPTGGSVNNSSGSGTFTFSAPLHQDNSGSRTLSASANINRPIAVTGTAYSVTDTAADTSLNASWTYPSIDIFTVDTNTAPTNENVVSGTGFGGTVNVRGNQIISISETVTNSSNVPQAFWFGVRSSITQPTTFQTGASVALLSDVTPTETTLTLSNTHTSEDYDFYGITLQPGNTYVSIS